MRIDYAGLPAALVLQDAVAFRSIALSMGAQSRNATELASHFSAKEIQGGTISFCDLKRLVKVNARVRRHSGLPDYPQSFDRYLVIGNRKQTVALVSRQLS